MSNTNRPSNAFAQGNQLYKTAATNGRKRRFETAEQLWNAAVGYFEYCRNNPIPHTVCRYKRIITVYKMQAMSVKGLSLYIDIYDLRYYKTLPEFADVVEMINNKIYVHNFTGAAAGLLSGRVVGRTLRTDAI